MSRRWRGDYLGDTSENVDANTYRNALSSSKEKIDPKTVLFSAMTVKFNRMNKANDRAIVFTKDNKIVKMDPAKKYKVMLVIPMSDVTGISLSPDDGNQLILVHLKSSNDLVLSLTSKKNEDLTGEAVGVLCAHFSKMMNRPLPVSVSNELKAKSGKKSKVVSVQAAAADTGFAKAADGGILYSAQSAKNGY